MTAYRTSRPASVVVRYHVTGVDHLQNWECVDTTASASKLTCEAAVVAAAAAESWRSARVDASAATEHCSACARDVAMSTSSAADRWGSAAVVAGDASTGAHCSCETRMCFSSGTSRSCWPSWWTMHSGCASCRVGTRTGKSHATFWQCFGDLFCGLLVEHLSGLCRPSHSAGLKYIFFIGWSYHLFVSVPLDIEISCPLVDIWSAFSLPFPARSIQSSTCMSPVYGGCPPVCDQTGKCWLAAVYSRCWFPHSWAYGENSNKWSTVWSLVITI